MSTKKEAYLCLSAMLRAREPKLLNGEKAQRMLDAASFAEAAKLLTDCGYEDMSQLDAAGVNAALNEHRNGILYELDSLVPEEGLVDIFREHLRGEGEYTFWDYRVKDSLARNIGWRIDHILGTQSAAALCRGVRVERSLRAMERPSDHTAVVGTFEL